MKKVLFLITKSNFGGAQRYVYDVATSLPRTEYDVVVALGGTGERGAAHGSLRDKLAAAGVRTIPITHFMRDVSFTEDIRALREVIGIVTRERPDVLHVTSSKAGGIGALAGRLTGVRTIVFTSHGLTFDESWRPAWQRALIWLFTWCTILLATSTIQISRDTYARAATMPFCKRRVHLVWNGIDAPDFFARDDARRTLVPGLPNSLYESLWLGTIAELHPNKHLEVLVDAVALLHRRGMPVHLVVMGEGEERAGLEERARSQNISEYIHLPGYVQDASKHLAALDVFALSSRKEGLPYVLLEAGFAGLPCVVSDIPGNTDVVEHGVSGLVAPADPEAFADAVGSLLEDAARRQALGDALKTRVAASFSKANMVSETVALY